MEYKSPEDHLDIDTFYKTLTYACLYMSYGKRKILYPDSEILDFPRQTAPEMTDSDSVIFRFESLQPC